MKAIRLILALLLTLLPHLSAAAVGDGYHPPISVSNVTFQAVQPWDGKLIIGGGVAVAPFYADRNLMRFNPDGSVDTSFDVTLQGFPYGMVLLPDRSMIVVGTFTGVTYLDENGISRTVARQGIVRLDTNGRPDSFNPAGAGFTSQLNVVALLADGKSVLIGGQFTSFAGLSINSLAKVSIDPASYGQVDPSYPGVDNSVNSIVVQDDHRVVLGGGFNTLTRGGVSTPHKSVARVNPDGTVDETFTASASARVYAIAQQPNGDLVVAGNFVSVTPSGGGAAVARRSIARLTRSGEVDAAFNPNPNSTVYSLKLQPDGKILMGGSFTTVGGVTRNRVARLNPDGSLDSFDPGLPNRVNSIALQPDGKIVLGQYALGHFTLNALPRYYPDGTMDNDVATTGVLPQSLTIPVALQPDGMLTVGGEFTSVGGQQRVRVARLKPDWTLADPPRFDPNLAVGGITFSLALQADWKMWMAGEFWLVECPMVGSCLDLIDNEQIGPTRAPHLSRVTPTGAFDPTVDVATGKTMYQNVQSLMVDRTGWVHAMALPPKGSPYEGMAYVGGEFSGDHAHQDMPEFLLMRMKANGERDPSFDPGELMKGVYGMWTGFANQGRVTAIAIQPDGKVLVAVNGVTDQQSVYITRGVLLRLLPETGALDPTFLPFYVNATVYSLGLQRDGQIVMAGRFKYPVSNGGNVYLSNVVRINNGRPGYADGTLDDSLFLEGAINDPNYMSFVYDLSLMADGSMAVAGVFDSLRDRLGTVARDSVAKIGPDGTVDRSFDVGPIDWILPLDKVDTAVVQPDGKVIIAGGFSSMNNGLDPRHNLARFATSKGALQSLTFAPDGSRVSWLRDGSSPEVWGVTFEDSPDGSNWTLLGSGSAIAGGWGINVANPVRQQTRYLRARGYGVTSSRDSILIEETRQYFLKPVLTVRAKGGTKRYGEANPALEVEYLGFEAGDTAANSLLGAPTVATPATAASGAGSYPITVGLGSLASAKYTFVLEDGVFTVTKAPLTVSVPAASRVYGDPDPAPGFIPAGLANGDTIQSVTLTSSATRWSPVGSAQTITPSAAVFSIGSPSNYDISYLPGALTITRRSLTVRADDRFKSAGDPNPPLTVSYTGLAPGEGAEVLSGAPALATAVGVLTPAGNYPITIAQGTLASGNYSFTLVGGTFWVANPMAQTITFTLKAHTYGDGDFLPGGSSTSGLPLGYSSADGAIAGIVTDGAGQERIRVRAPGTTQITASQGGNWQYFPASVTQTLTVNPPPWNGVSFDGVDDVLRVPDKAQLNFAAGESFTLEGWLHLAGGQPDGAGILSKGGGGGAGYALVLHQDRVGATLSDGVNSVGPAEGLVGTSSLNDGVWHQVALAVDRQGGMARLYLDGRLEKELALPPSLGTVASGADLLAGADGSGTLHFRGELDELRVWKAARSGDEIRAAGSQIIDPADQADLVAYFHLDEGDAAGGNAGVTGAPERTSFGNDGVLSGLALAGASSNWVRSGAFAPLLETTPITSLPPEGAVAGGAIFPNYYTPTDRGLCWGSAPNPGLADSCNHLGAGGGTFVSTIGGLTPGGSYHLRAFAVNDQGVAYGNDVSFQAGKRDQSITFGTLPTKTYGDPDFPPGGTSGSGLPLTYTSSDNTVAAVVGDQIHITGAGTTTITASQGGSPSYNQAADVPQTFTVLPAPLTVRADDKVRPYKSPDPPFTASYSGFVYGETVAVLSGAPGFSTSALWGSDAGGYPITPAAGTLSARNYRFVFAGGTLSITRTGQCITFPLIGERTFGDTPFTISAAACSGRSVSFVSSDASVVRVDGNTLVVVGAGTVTITARETGDGNFYGADEVSQTVVVHRAGQQVEFSSLAQKAVGDPPFQLSAGASSGLPVSYQSSDPAVAQIVGSMVTVVGPGTALITARQDGNANYNSAAPVLQTLTVAQEGVPPLVTLSTLSSGAATSNAVLNIQGVCGDASGLASVTVNGVPLGGDLTRFSYPLLLTSGSNSVTLSALDLAGNRTTETRSIELKGSGPALSVSTPADNAVTAEPQVLLQGTAGEGSTVTVTVNGSASQGLALIGGAFSATALLAEGVNTLEVRANAGGVATALKRSVTLAPGKPAVAITEPVQDVRTEEGRVVLRGTAAGSGVQVALSVNGASFAPPLVAGTFQQEIALDSAGTYRITATATSAAGSSTAYRNIIRSPLIEGDMNGDGVVDIGDARTVLSLSLGVEPVTPAALAHADVAPLVNGVPQPDGVIDVGDVVVLLRKVVGLVDF